MTTKSISLIIPAYKEEDSIVQQVKKLDTVLSELSPNYEIIVVVDGFNDKTYQNAKKIKNPNLKVLGYKKNMGKGYAVKHGVGKASKEAIGFIDSGMDLDPTEISTMLDIMDRNKADIVVGSKLHPESKIQYPIARKILSWGYRALARLLFGFKVRDTQVGLKLFKKKVAKEIFSKIITKRFAFDIELFVLASKLGYDKIYEVPIKLKFKQNTINPLTLWKTIFWMLYDTAAIFYRFRITHYYDKH
jgi:glycosyltransferase involved in cell wall biosynthesis